MKTTVSNILRLIREGKVNPEIRETAVGIIRATNIAATDYPSVIKAVAEWVKDNVMFVRDPYRTDIVSSATETLKMGFGDCEDQSVVAASFLQSIGLPVKFIIVSKTGQMWDHAFLRVGYPPDNPVNWISVDTTISPPSGREIPFVEQKVYKVE